jgi:hypothetical protein
MAQQIKLNIRKDITKLAGNKYGKVIYQTQVRDNINLEEEVVFIIPEQIDRAASSFVQGFFDDIIKKIGIEGIKTRITFQTNIPNFKQFVVDNLE